MDAGASPGADDAEEVGLFTVAEALEELELAFDHRDIIMDAYRKIQQMRRRRLRGSFTGAFYTERVISGHPDGCARVQRAQFYP